MPTYISSLHLQQAVYRETVKKPVLLYVGNIKVYQLTAGSSFARKLQQNVLVGYVN